MELSKIHPFLPENHICLSFLQTCGVQWKMGLATDSLYRVQGATRIGARHPGEAPRSGFGRQAGSPGLGRCWGAGPLLGRCWEGSVAGEGPQRQYGADP